MIYIQADEKIVLVDLSYYLIYRYHALQAWYKFSEQTYVEEEFFVKYKTLFIKNLKTIAKKFKTSASNIILAGDCQRCNIWRMEIFPAYKSNRDKINATNKINPTIFPFIYEDIIPELQKTLNIQYVCSTNLEADDVIYAITSNISNNVVILTNDNDYLQMQNERVSIVNLPRLQTIYVRGLDSAWINLMFKVLSGDVSDNIPRILKKKTVMELLEDGDDSKLYAYIKEKGLTEVYERNRSLVDMQMIPQNLLEEIIQQVKVRS